jgi:hypothetical protein
MKYLDEVVYILDIKIYRDRSRKLIGLSQGTYIELAHITWELAHIRELAHIF